MISFGTGGWRAIIGDEFTRETEALAARTATLDLTDVRSLPRTRCATRSSSPGSPGSTGLSTRSSSSSASRTVAEHYRLGA